MLLGDKLDKQVHIALRERGAVVNTAIVLVCAKGIVMKKDINLLSSNGGHILLPSNWGKSTLRCMGFVKRNVSTTAKVPVTNFEELKAQFLLDVNVSIEMDEIHHALVINSESNMFLLDLGLGSKSLEITGADDKRQITCVVFALLAYQGYPRKLKHENIRSDQICENFICGKI